MSNIHQGLVELYVKYDDYCDAFEAAAIAHKKHVDYISDLISKTRELASAIKLLEEHCD